MDFLQLYFQPDHPAYGRPATTMILPLTTVVTMAISDVNKLLMLQYEPLIDTLILCLCLDDGNNRKGQKGVGALQDASTDIILQLALFEPGREALIKHASVTQSLQQLLKSDATPVAVEQASGVLFQLERHHDVYDDVSGASLTGRESPSSAGGFASPKSIKETSLHGAFCTMLLAPCCLLLPPRSSLLATCYV